MPKLTLFGVLSFAVIVTPLFATSDGFPTWAYPVNSPGGVQKPDNGSVIHLPGSSAGFTRKQLSTITGPVSDWYPEEHHLMPPIVANGRPPTVFACGYCHLPNGAGRPENASLAGLSAGYIKQQMAAFKQGDRPGSEPRRAPQTTMIALAKAATDAEIDAAAVYFSALKPASFLTVKEAEVIPKPIVAAWTITTAPEGETELLNGRIIEMPVDFQRFENRDAHTPYVAFVPVGSVKRGAELVTTTAGDKTLQCITCHGVDLRGMADVPRLVGRSPSYLMRQLYDFRSNMRKGGAANLMKPVVAQLSDEDMVAIVAYLASRNP